MPFSLYEATLPSKIQILGAAQGWIAKARASDIAEADIAAAKLAEDMLPFAYQVKSMAVHSVGAIEGVRRGSFSPDMSEPATSLDAMQANLAAAEATLRGLHKAEVDAFIGGETRFVFAPRGVDMPFASEDFLLSFSQPNFYFHATTAYAILRHLGIKVGKIDFLGMPRVKQG